MRETGNCPTCRAPVNIEHDWDSSSYYFDSYTRERAEEAQQAKTKALRARIKKLEARLAKSLATSNRLWTELKHDRLIDLENKSLGY